MLIVLRFVVYESGNVYCDGISGTRYIKPPDPDKVLAHTLWVSALRLRALMCVPSSLMQDLTSRRVYEVTIDQRCLPTSPNFRFTQDFMRSRVVGGIPRLGRSLSIAAGRHPSLGAYGCISQTRNTCRRRVHLDVANGMIYRERSPRGWGRWHRSSYIIITVRAAPRKAMKHEPVTTDYLH